MGWWTNEESSALAAFSAMDQGEGRHEGSRYGRRQERIAVRRAARVAVVLGALVFFEAPAQEIVIPEEFLVEKPPPLEFEVVDDGEPVEEEDEAGSDVGAESISLGGDTRPAGEGAIGAGLGRPTVDFESDYFGYFRGAPGAGDNNLVRADLKMKFEGRVGENFFYTVTPQLRQDSGDNGVNTLEFLENEQRRPLATFHEAFLAWSSERFHLSAGKQIFNWGVSDAHNPLDDLNPRDFLDVPTNERIGVPSLAVYHLNDLFELQAVWEPWFTPSRLPLPGMDNRWLGDFATVQARASAQVGFPVGLAFAGRDLPADQFENGQFAVRLSSSTLLDGWDLAVTYFRGRLAEGVFVGALQGATLVAALEYPRYHEFGASVATVIGDWQLHGEGSWHLTDDERLDDDYLEYVAGINRSFSDLPLPLVEEVRLILEYAGQTVTRGLPTGSPSFGSRQFARPFQDALAASVVFKFSEETELECAGAYDFADRGSIFEASLTHEVNDNIEVTLGADLFSGGEESFFGKWDANDRIFLTLALIY